MKKYLVRQTYYARSLHGEEHFPDKHEKWFSFWIIARIYGWLRMLYSERFTKVEILSKEQIMQEALQNEDHSTTWTFPN